METTTSTPAAPTWTPPTQTRTQAQPPTQTQDLSFREKLDAGEHLWLWKLSLRVLLLVLAVVGTGCVAWAVQTGSEDGTYGYMYFDEGLLTWGLLTFGISIVWTLICILVLVLRRPPRPVHPGIAVGMDLVLWMGYIFTTILAAVACSSIMLVGADTTGSVYDGYTQASNGTWVWDDTTRACESDYSNIYYQQFANCTEQAAWINARAKVVKHRAGVELTGTICQGLCLVLHFILFVWACVDTHRRNKRKTNGDAEKIAAEIVAKMVRDGAILQSHRRQWSYQHSPVHLQQPHQPYTVHSGPPPPLDPSLPTRHQAGAPTAPQIVEYYASNEEPRGLDGPGPAHQPIVEHYGNEKRGAWPHAI